MADKIRISVTQEDIMNAIKDENNTTKVLRLCLYCPIAQALKRIYHKDYVVTRYCVYNDDTSALVAQIPKDIAEKVTEQPSETWNRLRPFEFDLELYEGQTL